MAESFVAKYSGLPLGRDLTLNEEAAQVLSIASEILSSDIPLENIRDLVYKDPSTTPPILISAVGSAESKLKLRDCGPHHMTCIFAMYGEQNRIRTKAEHENGEDLLRNKVKQLKWLFDGEEGKSWDILAVDDGCPNDSIRLARNIVAQEGYDNVRLLHLQEAIDQQIPFFVRDRKLKNTKESRKGGAILYGLRWVAENASLVAAGGGPHLVMYTDSDLSTDMSLCGLLSAGIISDGCSMSMGARYGSPGTFLVKDKPRGHPESHFDKPDMMNIVFRHYCRVRLLPMLTGIYDTQCAFKCFKVTDVKQLIASVQSMGPDFDMELLLCTLRFYRESGVAQEKLCRVYGTLFAEDFAESNFTATAGSDDPDKHFKTYLGMTQGILQMHQRYIDANSAEAKQAVEFVEFCRALDLAKYKKMIQTLQAELGPTLFDYDFGLESLKKAAA